MYLDGAAIRPLESGEMQELFGGMEALAPSSSTSFLYDFFWLVGRATAEVVSLASTTYRPPSPYTYAKVGYTS